MQLKPSETSARLKINNLVGCTVHGGQSCTRRLHMVLGQFVICGRACGPHFARAWRYRCERINCHVDNYQMSMSYKWNRNKLPWTWSWVDYDTGIRFCVKYSPTNRLAGPRCRPKHVPWCDPPKLFLAIVQVQGAKRVLNTPTCCSKNRSRHAPRTQTKGLSTFFGDPNTLKSGPFKWCLYPMHPRPNAFVVRTEFKSARVSARVI